MPTAHSTQRARRRTARPLSFMKQLEEISMFFQGKDEVHKTLRRLTRRLEKAGIAYAIVGGIAVHAHHYERTTKDVDILLSVEGFSEFRSLFVPKNYQQVPKRPRRFVDRVNEVTIDILVTGKFPGTGKPGPIAYPDPQAVREMIGKHCVVNLENLVQLKLAARRYQDFADVVALIRFNQLDESFAERLHASVRQDYIECLEEKRREDEYETAQDEQMADQYDAAEYEDGQNEGR